MKEKTCYNCIHTRICAHKKHLIGDLTQTIYAFTQAVRDQADKAPIHEVSNIKVLFSSTVIAPALNFLANNCEEYCV